MAITNYVLNQRFCSLATHRGFTFAPIQLLSSTDVGNFSWNQRDKLKICIEWHIRHHYNRLCNMLDIHRRLHLKRSIRLLRCVRGSWLICRNRSVTDVELSTGDVVFSTVERERTSESSDRSLSRSKSNRIRSRHMC